MGRLIWAGLAALIVLLVWFGLRAKRPAAPQLPVLIIDGSNVMHWGDGSPRLAAVEAVVREVEGRGFLPVVYFDANVGYKLAGRHMDAARLARMLGLGKRQIEVVPSGTPADPWLIERAIALEARVISNDRFQDWRGTYPALRGRRFLVKGDVRGKKVELDL